MSSSERIHQLLSEWYGRAPTNPVECASFANEIIRILREERSQVEAKKAFDYATTYLHRAYRSAPLLSALKPAILKIIAGEPNSKIATIVAPYAIDHLLRPDEASVELWAAIVVHGAAVDSRRAWELASSTRSYALRVLSSIERLPSSSLAEAILVWLLKTAASMPGDEAAWSVLRRFPARVPPGIGDDLLFAFVQHSEPKAADPWQSALKAAAKERFGERGLYLLELCVRWELAPHADLSSALANALSTTVEEGGSETLPLDLMRLAQSPVGMSFLASAWPFVSSKTAQETRTIVSRLIQSSGSREKGVDIALVILASRLPSDSDECLLLLAPSVAPRQRDRFWAIAQIFAREAQPGFALRTLCRLYPLLDVQLCSRLAEVILDVALVVLLNAKRETPQPVRDLELLVTVLPSVASDLPSRRETDLLKVVSMLADLLAPSTFQTLTDRLRKENRAALALAVLVKELCHLIDGQRDTPIPRVSLLVQELQRYSALRIELPPRVRNDPSVFRHLPFELALSTIVHADSYQVKTLWDLAEIPLKVATLKCCGNDLNAKRILVALASRDRCDLVRGIAVLISDADSSQDSFRAFHAALERYVLAIAWDLDQSISLNGVLPLCEVPESGVSYCEGRPLRNSGSAVYCPRLGDRCSKAWIKPRTGLRRPEATLLEILGSRRVTPMLDGLSNPAEYVPKLSGWVNRLNEIRSRFRCRKCMNALVPNMKYAKFLAGYNVTVASCSSADDGHDHNVYFNHCWACFRIVDSREAALREDGYYLCVHCGSGPRESATFRQGDKCPKCGELQMRVNARRAQCRRRSCLWTICLPPKNKMTGPLDRLDYSPDSD